MRALVLMLLLANVALLAYTRLDRASEGEGARLAQQVRPEGIKLLSAQQVAALGPAKIAALADVCLEWGPFADADRARALAALESASLGRLLTQKRVESSTAWWVFLPRSANRNAIDRRLAEVKSAGVRDAFVVDAGALRYTISLGVFRTEEAASAFAADLARQGIADARAGPRQQVVVQTLLVIRDPDAAVIARIKGLQPEFPGSEAKVGACDRAN